MTMALINCPECGKQISDKSTQCIHCGCPIEKKQDEPKNIPLSASVTVNTPAQTVGKSNPALVSMKSVAAKAVGFAGNNILLTVSLAVIAVSLIAGIVLLTGKGYSPSSILPSKSDVSTRKPSDYLSAGGFHTVGLKEDGTVIAAGSNYFGQCNVSGWTDIVAVTAGGFHTVGLKRDGTVVAAGSNEEGECNVSGWSNVVKIAAGNDITVGIRSDGTVLVVGNNDYGQCNVSGWKIKSKD